jgi:phosphatidylserine/phosphatidylglycerophosphate/cardiolipin synthase-like enzyme
MKTRVRVYVNSDDALLVWSVDEVADGCEGFAIQRDGTVRGTATGPVWLDNFAPPGPAAHQNGVLHPSDERPFRRFSWTDHDVGPGDEVRYRVAPVLGGTRVIGQGSRWSARRRIAAPGGAYTPYFNRGFVISQFMSRYLRDHFKGLDLGAALDALKRELSRHEAPIRAFLAGQLRVALLDFLGGVAADEQLHAALYELNETELEDTLIALGARAHVVLANGSITANKGESSAAARLRDQNQAARERLKDGGVDVSDRFISPGALGHNKVLVVVGPAGDPRRVWTGSTNWTVTGLCTQLNNGLRVDDKRVAKAYLGQWTQLRAAGGDHPATLTQSNGVPTTVGKLSVHFSRVSGRVDLGELATILQDAEQGVLFLMFQPGGSGVVATVEALASNASLLLRGVISTLPKGAQDEHTGTTTTLHVSLFGDPSAPEPIKRTFDVVQPQGFTNVAAGWAEETTRALFLGHVGNAIIHSKVLVVDPFSASPTVVTGSHNFSISASEANDENFVVVRGDRALAEAYAVNIESAWRHYAARIGTPHRELTGVPYLRALLADQRGEERFWKLAP